MVHQLSILGPIRLRVIRLHRFCGYRFEHRLQASALRSSASRSGVISSRAYTCVVETLE